MHARAQLVDKGLWALCDRRLDGDVVLHGRAHADAARVAAVLLAATAASARHDEEAGPEQQRDEGRLGDDEVE